MSSGAQGEDLLFVTPNEESSHYHSERPKFLRLYQGTASGVPHRRGQWFGLQPL
jgi:hypothetical protein